jgi:SAM-dependent methyltransferase
MARPVHRFLELNRRLSQRWASRVESAQRFYGAYDDRVADAARALGPGSAIVDLGGGRSCSFADVVGRSRGVRIVAVDISPDELAANNDVDEVRVADVANGLPFRDGEVSLLVSRTLLEHIQGVPAAMSHIGRVVAPGGRTIHLVPCRNSLFALVGRLVPWRLARPVVHLVFPPGRGVIEFEPYYDHCEPRTLERVLRDAGFSQVRIDVSWAQTDYFQAFYPLFVVVWAYQALMRRLNVRRLAAYAIVDAVR